MIEAVVFDLDGILIHSEEVWDAVRERYVRERGGRYDEEVQRAMMGMSSAEWSRYLHEHAGVPDSPEAINAEVVRRMLDAYRQELPLVDGARRGGAAARGTLAARPRLVLEPAADRHRARARRPRPAASASPSRRRRSRGASRRPTCTSRPRRRLGVSPQACAAIEDSHSGIAAARAAGMHVVAVPNPSYPPGDEALAAADVVLGSIAELTVEMVEALDG